VKTLLIDNYDSFTFNLFQLIAEVNDEEPFVVRNDGASWEELASWEYDNIVVSPGPGRPERPSDFGVCSDAIRESDVPLLGVCLGHQGLGHLSGGTVVHAPEVMHGRLSTVRHNGSPLFAGIPQEFEVVRYHSLCVASPTPEDLEVIAWTDDGVIMGIRHLHRPSFGVQFHPESICTSYGRELLRNFRDLTTELGSASTSRERSRPRSIVLHRAPSDDAGQSGLRLSVRKLDGVDDPERAFVHFFGTDPHAFWLDSSRTGDERSRFSFMGGADGPLSSLVYYDVAAKEVTVVGRDGSTAVHRETIFEYLGRELQRLRIDSEELPFDFNCGFVGYLGYELKADCGGSIVHRSPLPDAVFLLADRLLAFDHEEGCCYAVCLVDDETADEGERWLDDVSVRLQTAPPLPATGWPSMAARRKPVDFYLSRSHETYIEDIQRCKQYLRDGETYEVCLTNKVKTDVTPDPLALYRTARHVNPAPFSAFLRYGDAALVCSSPERFLRIQRDRWVEAKPIKGTVRRGRTPDEDLELSEQLRSSEKNRAENLMITDLLRNDLGVVCEIGSVHVPHLFAVETFETVHQLVSTIRGRLRENLGAADCIQACFPGGSMTGAPKKRTMEIIDELEQEARGVYSGSIGYIGLCGAADLNIVIRTIVMDGESTSIGMGGAIVMQSDAEEEYEETILKAKALMKAIVLCVNGQSAGVADDGDPESTLAWALEETTDDASAVSAETRAAEAGALTPS
jgi:para-aminobenzoate synthetase